MILSEARTRMRLDLSDVDADMLTDDALNRAVERAVSDLSRYLPLEDVYETTLIFEVSDEAWASAAAAGTYVSLASKPIKYGSETVKNAAGTICTRDTDYYIDYSLGKITHIDGGNIGDAENCTISYTKSKVAIDISSILSSLIRIDRVEYPVGDVPQSFVSFNLAGSIVTTMIGNAETQESMAEKKHLAVYYKTVHTAPTPTANGSYPAFLDDTVILAADAYALFSLAIDYNGQAVTDLASMRTALDNTVAIHVLIDAALDKVATYMENNASEDTKYWLTKITTDLASLRTAINAASDAANTYTDSIAADLVTATSHLTTGATKINSVNVGDRVPENYREFSGAEATIANARGNAALIYIQEVAQRLSNLRSYIEQAAGWNRVADTFVSEANSRISEMDRHLSEANQYQIASGTDLTLADRFRTEAIERRNEAWTVWRSAPDYIPNISSSPVRQLGR